MKRIGVILPTILFLFISVSAFSQDNTVIAKVGDESITFGQIEKAFNKNSSREVKNLAQLSTDSVIDFLNIYINYRLKVHEALRQGVDKDPDVSAEIKRSRNLLAERFFYDNKVKKPYVDKLVQMRNREFKIGLILITKELGTEGKSSAGEARVKEVFAALNSGEKFEDVAEKYSDDTKTKSNGGIIPYFMTSGKVAKDIEEVIFALKPSEYAKEAVETNYAYFIIKLIADEKRVNVRTAHILITQGDTPEDSLAAYNKADSLLTLLRNGVDFAKIAEMHSDDESTAIYGGEFQQLYSRSTGLDNNMRPFLPEFEDKLFALKDGEISDIAATEFGFHIIKRLETLPVDVEAERDEIEKMYERIYYQKEKDEYIDKIARSYGLMVNKTNLDVLTKALEQSKTNLDTAWVKNIPAEMIDKTLWTLLGKNYTVDSFIKESLTNRDLKGDALNEIGIRKSIMKLARPLVFEKASENLENEFLEFADLTKEFKDGILLYQVESEAVWNKMKFDSVEAKKYWEPIKENYKRETYFDISEIYVLNDTMANEIYEKVKNGEDFAKLAVTYSMRDGGRENSGHIGLVSATKDKNGKLISEANLKKGEMLSPFNEGKGWTILYVNNVEEPRTKTYEEAIPDFAAKYQDMMQKRLLNNWITELKQTFKVVIFEDKLKEALKR